jgi:hypothetical protein
MISKNWMGQPWHEVDNYCWFKSTPEEREELRDLFDGLIGDIYPENKVQRDHLIKLIEKVRAIAVEETEFHSQGD